MSSLSLSLRRAAGHVVRHPGISAAAIAAIAMVVACVGLARLVSANVHQLTEHWAQGVQMIVYLEDGVSEQQAAEIGRVLSQLPAVENVTYVPAERALEQLRLSLGGQLELTDGLEEGMLPASLEVALVEGTRNVASAGPVISRLERIPGIESVEFLGAWADRLTVLVDKLRAGGMALTALACALVVIVVVAAMRLTSRARRTEDRILALEGATALWRSGTAAVQGALLGLAGAVLAVVVVGVLFVASAPAIESALDLIVAGAGTEFLGVAEVAGLIAVGTGLGAVGAVLAQRFDARAL